MTAVDDEPVVLAAEATGASIEADVYADKPMARGDIHDTGISDFCRPLSSDGTGRCLVFNSLWER